MSQVLDTCGVCGRNIAEHEQTYTKDGKLVCSQCAGKRPPTPMPMGYATPEASRGGGGTMAMIIVAAVVAVMVVAGAGFYFLRSRSKPGPLGIAGPPSPKLAQHVSAGPPISGMEALAAIIPGEMYDQTGGKRILDLRRSNQYLQEHVLGREFSMTAPVTRVEGDDAELVISVRNPADSTTEAPLACQVVAKVPRGQAMDAAMALKEGDSASVSGEIEDVLCQDGARVLDNGQRTESVLLYVRLKNATAKAR